jgi:hypothetical protein
MPRQLHPRLLDHPNKIWLRVHIVKLLIVHFSSASCYFLPLRYKHSPTHPILKDPQIYVHPSDQETKNANLNQQKIERVDSTSLLKRVLKKNFLAKVTYYVRFSSSYSPTREHEISLR